MKKNVSQILTILSQNIAKQVSGGTMRDSPTFPSPSNDKKTVTTDISLDNRGVTASAGATVTENTTIGVSVTTDYNGKFKSGDIGVKVNF